MFNIEDTIKSTIKCKQQSDHSWKFDGFLGEEVYFKCLNCGEIFSREMSEKEKEIRLENSKRLENIHKVYNYVIESIDGLCGIDLIDKFQDLAKKDPENIRICKCDDSMYSSSLLAFVEHKTQDMYHGTTVFFVPQNREYNENAYSKFFLHETNIISLILILENIQSKSRFIIDEESQKDYEFVGKFKPC